MNKYLFSNQKYRNRKKIENVLFSVNEWMDEQSSNSSPLKLSMRKHNQTACLQPWQWNLSESYTISNAESDHSDQSLNAYVSVSDHADQSLNAKFFKLITMQIFVV